MHAGTHESDDRDARLNKVLLDYVETIERGVPRDPEEILAAHPDLAADLAAFFAGRKLMERMASPFLATAQPGDPSVERSKGSGASDHRERKDLGRIGDFRLIREVGSGGMGVVYEAEQISLRRHVAIKILPFAATFDSRQLQRFRNEAQAAAQLHHTAVVPIFAVGVESGVHYYAMQFIDGQSLAELIDGLRRMDRKLEDKNRHDPSHPLASEDPLDTSLTIDYPPVAPPERRREWITPSAVATATLTAISTEHRSRAHRYFERVAGLGVQAAEGLEHAHQVGVVHRDVKPANLLLDARGDLWVTDFGLALFRSDPGLTMTGELVGTVRFMSPEQAMGKKGLIDHRTDIYSLGITLYELLTLTPAFDGRDRHELLRQIAFEEPKTPRSIDSSIPVELETIVLKAIAKDPADRYASAQELADDLKRFIDDRPILARRPTLPEIAARWVRRHRIIAFTCVAAMAVAMVGLSIFASILSHEHAATKLALKGQREKTREADEQRALAEANFLSARKAVDFFVELSQEELLDFPPMMDVRRRLLEASVAYYQELNEKRPGDPSLRQELASNKARLDQLIKNLATIRNFFICMLLTDAKVQQELDLSFEQVRKVQEATRPLTAFLSQGSSIPGESARGGRWRLPIVKAQTALRTLDGALTPQQMHRLLQIALQHPGPHSFTDPQTIHRLELTEDQQVQVREIQVEAERKILDLIGLITDRQEIWRHHQAAWKTASEQIIALFTPAQKAKWSEMIGAPFQSTMPLFFQSESDSQSNPW